MRKLQWTSGKPTSCEGHESRKPIFLVSLPLRKTRLISSRIAHKNSASNAFCFVSDVYIDQGRAAGMVASARRVCTSLSGRSHHEDTAIVRGFDASRQLPASGGSSVLKFGREPSFGATADQNWRAIARAVGHQQPKSPTDIPSSHGTDISSAGSQLRG